MTMNPGLKNGIERRDLAYLRAIRDSMNGAEIGHWAGAVGLLAVTVMAIWIGKSSSIIVLYVVFNLFGNVYFSLLQQYNKLKLDRVLARLE